MLYRVSFCSSLCCLNALYLLIRLTKPAVHVVLRKERVEGKAGVVKTLETKEWKVKGIHHCSDSVSLLNDTNIPRFSILLMLASLHCASTHTYTTALAAIAECVGKKEKSILLTQINRCKQSTIDFLIRIYTQTGWDDNNQSPRPLSFHLQILVLRLH